MTLKELRQEIVEVLSSKNRYIKENTGNPNFSAAIVAAENMAQICEAILYRIDGDCIALSSYK